MPSLLDPFTLRGVTFRNRVGVSPMCMYSSVDGMPNDWHLVHLGARATGGAGLIITEASAVEPRGRITPGDAGLYDDAQAEAWARIARFVKAQGAAFGVQLAHAGRKASCDVPWLGGKPLNDVRAWETIGASALPFADGWPAPREMTLADIAGVVDAFGVAAGRAVTAGFDFIELHAAHGYLLHSFYSPLSNHRTDAYGTTFDGRTRLIREAATRIRATIPESMPLFVRLSCSDWTDGGWTIQDSVTLAKHLAESGVDLIDCSSGGNVPGAPIPGTTRGYQVPFAARIRREANLATAAVGMIEDARQADAIIAAGEADVALIARASLRDPNFALRAAMELTQPAMTKPPTQYARAW